MTYAFLGVCGATEIACAVVVTGAAAPALACPAIAPVEFCGLADFAAPLATVVDGCGDTFSIAGEFEAAVDCIGGAFNVEYAYEGICGDAEILCAVTVLGAAAPTIACPAIAPVDFCDLGDFLAPTAIATDACGATAIIPGSMNIALMNCDGGIFDISYTFEGICGTTTATCPVTVLPAEEAMLECPVIPLVPFCELANFSAPLATALVCGAEEDVAGTFAIGLIDCAGGTFDVTYTFMGCGGNMITCVVTVDVAPAPTLSCPVIEPVAHCDIFTFTPPLGIANPGCGGEVAVAGGFAITEVPCDGGTFDVTYEYTECGVVAAVCEVTLLPAPAPEFLCPDAPIMLLGCDVTTEDIPSSVQLIDACGAELTITEFTEVIDFTCPVGLREVTRTFTYSDACNTTSCAVITVLETPNQVGASVFVDEDASGCFSPGDTFLPGVTVQLFRTYECDGAGFPIGEGEPVPGGIALSGDTGAYVIDFCGCELGFLFVEFSGFDGFEPIVQDPNCTSFISSEVNAAGRSKCFPAGIPNEVPHLGLKPLAPPPAGPVCDVPCVTDATVFVQDTTTMDNGTATFNGSSVTLVGSDIDPADHTSMITYNQVCFTADECDTAISFDWSTTMPGGFLAGDVSFFSIDSVNTQLSQCFVDTDGDGDIDLRDCASDSGSEVIIVPAGSEFCFLQMSDNQFSEATTVFSNIMLCTDLSLTEEKEEVSTRDRAGDEKTAEANVYPNPVMGNLFLDVTAPRAAVAKGMMYTNMGEVVLEIDEYEVAKGSNQKVLDVSGMTAGTYILRLEVGKEVFFSRVTVIN